MYLIIIFLVILWFRYSFQSCCLYFILLLYIKMLRLIFLILTYIILFSYYLRDCAAVICSSSVLIVRSSLPFPALKPVLPKLDQSDVSVSLSAALLCFLCLSPLSGWNPRVPSMMPLTPLPSCSGSGYRWSCQLCGWAGADAASLQSGHSLYGAERRDHR